MAAQIKGLFNKAEMKGRILAVKGEGRTLPDYDLAVLVAVNALIGQTCKAGAAYAHHLISVSRHNTDSERKMIIGMLHDLVEDSDWTLDDLRDIGFSEKVIAGVDGVTHRDGELYFDSIERCGLNPDSVDVKLKDNRHNLDQSRNNWLPKPKDLERQAKYIITRQYLISIKQGDIEPGTPVYEWMKTQPEKMQDFALAQKESSYRPPQGTAPAPQQPVR
ncbi:MAG: hypothetical protein H6867_02775 [Rhodospirillales bacterium]|nr:hypothetical protein [Rhodospirillales bacterium]MCB9997113.1 hypothetical protein [Rhodospirillales bacterium]